MIRKSNLLTLFLVAISLSSSALFAGEIGHKKGKHSELSQQEELKYELSFLAKKMLDMSGEDNIEISQEPYRKPFLGICSNVTPGGVQLTCITPGHSAEAAGLRSGDLVVKINDVSMMAPNTKVVKKTYFGMINEMKTGEKMSFTVYRGPTEKTIDVTVGELSQPGYTMTIRRK